MKNLFRWLICGVVVVGVLGVAHAQFAKPEEAIGYRQAAMYLIGQHFGRIAAVVQGKKPFDLKDVTQNAVLVDTLSKLPLEAFLTPGTEKGMTHLKPSALKEQKAFKAATDASTVETGKLVQVAAGDDLKAIKTQFGVVGKTCKGCHEKYRSR